MDILPEFDFRKFIATGEWDHAHTILVGPKTRDGTLGYQIITPLVREDGSTVLVDRGFVSKEHVSSDRRTRSYYQPKGKVNVLGMLRTQLQKKNAFTPDNKPEKGEWYWPDIERMKQWLGGDERNVEGVFLEEIFGEYTPSTDAFLPDKSLETETPEKYRILFPRVSRSDVQDP